MTALKTFGIFVVALLGELGGTYAVWRWLRSDAPPLLALAGVAALFGYATVLSRAAERFRARAEHAGRAITTEAPDGLELVGDELRLEQALGNLIENALRHGGGAVVVSGAVAEGAVELHVLDEGPGFPPGFLGTAFERFTRSDEARASGGAGLGLAIVDVIARAHGGEAGAANRPGGGADVWLSIPTS